MVDVALNSHYVLVVSGSSIIYSGSINTSKRVVQPTHRPQIFLPELLIINIPQSRQQLLNPREKNSAHLASKQERGVRRGHVG